MDSIRLFLTGDVMTGRGIDQILPHPCDPHLHEPYVRDAYAYVRLAEEVNGPIRRPVDFSYIWGDVLELLDDRAPDLRIVNLETSVTTSDDYWQGKGINYRMNPDNVGCLTAAGIDCCAIANNHVIDWGYDGFEETLATLRAAGLGPAGGGLSAKEAEAPAVFDLGAKGRVLVFGFGAASSGIPPAWAAGPTRPGVNLLPQTIGAAETFVTDSIAAYRRPGDLVIASIHWGGNWGYEIPAEHQELAHALVGRAGVDLIHGHSSHHALGIEILDGRPIIYGCGDFVNDYEGISGHAEYRGDLRLAYCLDLRSDGGGLEAFDVIPFRSRRFRLERAARSDVSWVESMLRRESAVFGVGVRRASPDTLSLSAG